MNKGSPSIMEGSLLTLSLYMLVFFGVFRELGVGNPFYNRPMRGIA